MQKQTLDDVAGNKAARRGRPAGVLGRSHNKKLGDRLRISRLYLHGYSVEAIANQTGLGERLVQSEITAVRRDWLSRTNINMQIATFQQLDRIDAIENEAHQGWIRSLGPVTVETRQATTTARGTVNRATVRNGGARDGNPAFLAQMAWCVEQRCKILGLEKPVAVEVRGTFAEIAMGIDWNALGLRGELPRNALGVELSGVDGADGADGADGELVRRA